jgi:hypothetical protein
MCEIKYPTKSAFKYLEELRTLFYITFSKEEIDNAFSYSLNGAFRKTLKEKMEFYSKNPNSFIDENLNNLNYLNNSDTPMAISSSEVLSQRGEDKINLVVQKSEKNDTNFIKPSYSLLSQNVRNKNFYSYSTYLPSLLISEEKLE